MGFSREKLREVVLQMLYSEEFGKIEGDDLKEFIETECKISKGLLEEAYNRFNNIKKEISNIDNIINEISKGYNFERISKVELNILRLGGFELMFDKEVPPKVAISEAIRICRKFGTRDSANFVNAILDEIYKCYVNREEGKEASKVE